MWIFGMAIEKKTLGLISIGLSFYVERVFRTFKDVDIILFSWWLKHFLSHISILNCDEMAGDRPRQPAYEIFSIQRRF